MSSYQHSFQFPEPSNLPQDDVRSNSGNINSSEPISISLPSAEEQGSYYHNQQRRNQFSSLPKPSPVLHFSFNPHAIGSRILNEDSHRQSQQSDRAHERLSRSWVPSTSLSEHMINKRNHRKSKNLKKEKRDHPHHPHHNDSGIHATRQSSSFIGSSFGAQIYSSSYDSHHPSSHSTHKNQSVKPKRYSSVDLNNYHNNNKNNPLEYNNALSLKDIHSLRLERIPSSPSIQFPSGKESIKSSEPLSDNVEDDIPSDNRARTATLKLVLLRGIVLLLISIIGMGPFFAYDSVAALATRLEDHFRITADSVGMLFSAYSAPNVIFIIFSGFIVDKYGTNKTCILFTVCYIAGCILVAEGTAFWHLLAGRALLGIGAESLFVARSTLLSKWFGRTNCLNFAFGFASAISECGSSIGFFLLPSLASQFGLKMALYSVVAFGVACLIVTLILLVIDTFLYPEESQMKRSSSSETLSSNDEDENGNNEDYDDEEWDDQQGDMENASTVSDSEKSDEETEEGISLSVITRLPFSFWLVVMVVFTMQSTLYSFFALGSDFFQFQYNVSDVRAGQLMGMFAIGQILSPIFGILIDRLSRFHLVFLWVCPFLYCSTFALFLFPHLNPVFVMAGIVVVYAVGETTIYSSIPLLVSRQVLGTAFGITSMVYNAGLLVLPVVLGKLKEVMGSYRVSVMLMCGMFLLAFLACTILNLLHKVENGREGNQVKRRSCCCMKSENEYTQLSNEEEQV